VSPDAEGDHGAGTIETIAGKVDGMEGFELAILFTTAGAAVGAALIKTIVSAAKSFGLTDHGRAPMIAALALSVFLIGLATWDEQLFADGVSGADILVVVLAIVGLYTASVGVHETVSKVQRIASGTTDPSGPDN
jgi:hypothetical protein